MSELVSFSSDYGSASPYVGICHLVIARIAPDVRVVDVAHTLRGIRGGAAVLERSLPYAPGAVHLAIVDPGVGTARRPVAVRSADGSTLVGPDNGLLIGAAEALGGVTEAFELVDPAYRLAPVSATFHGRDVFAPAAAHLATGVPASDLGPRVDAADLVTLPPPYVAVAPGELDSDVLWTDDFGNLVLAATVGDLERSALSGTVAVEAGATVATARVGRTFADAAPGELVVYVDSAGRVAVARNGASAGEALGDPGRLRITGP